MGLSRLADRELYQHGTAPTLVAQLDPDAALAEGRAALELSQTTFVAETSLPTKYGRFRVRAYRHSVRPRPPSPSPSCCQVSWYVGRHPYAVRMFLEATRAPACEHSARISLGRRLTSIMQPCEGCTATGLRSCDPASAVPCFGLTPRRWLQVDGGDTFTEPSVIMTGRPERQENVVVRVHDACFTSGARWVERLISQ